MASARSVFPTKSFYSIPHDGSESEEEIPESDYEAEMNRSSESEEVVSETSDFDSEDEEPLASFVPKRKIHQKKEQKIIWSDKNLGTYKEEDFPFLGNSELPETMSQFETPAEFFSFFFTEDLIQMIVDESNRKALQGNINKPANITVKEMETFIGICLFMSLVKLPSARGYWSSEIGQSFVYETMTCNGWEDIKRHLYFTDNDKFIKRGLPGHDKLFKVRPLLSKIRDRLLLIPKEEFLAVDEQTVPTKCRHELKQYNPKKPGVIRIWF